MSKVIIEIRGGVCENVFSDDHNIDIVLIDWDNIKQGGETVNFPVETLKGMSWELVNQLGESICPNCNNEGEIWDRGLEDTILCPSCKGKSREE